MTEEINYAKVFEVLDKITGLPLKRKGSRWFGACYIDGSASPRWDKLSCRLLKDGIQMLEQGGASITIWTYLKDYHGLNNGAVYEKLQGLSQSNIVVSPPRPVPPLQYVYPSTLARAKESIGIVEDSLFQYLVSHFGRRKVILAYNMFNVTPFKMKDGRVATTFWYVDSTLRILHDKGILYGDNGKRDHSFGGCRRFKLDQGFRAHGYFGEHLLSYKGDQTVYLVESEKTAILMWLYYGRVCLATGGSTCLRRVEPGWVLLPDWDTAGDLYWCRWFPEECHDWWNDFPDVPIERGWDIGDVIMYKLNKRKNGEKTESNKSSRG